MTCFFFSFFFPFSFLGFPEYAPKFRKHKVGGPELITVGASDLKAIGISAVGHQKSILAKIKDLSIDKIEEPTSLDQRTPRSDRSGFSEYTDDDSQSQSQSSSAVSSVNCMELICQTGDSRRQLTVKRRYGLERILSILEESFQMPMEILVNGKVLDDPQLWADVVSKHSLTEPLEIEVTRQDKNKIFREEKAMLHGLTDGCIIIDTVGKVLFSNYALEELLGYQPDDLIGRNISEITPPDVRAKHDMYLRRYLESGNAKVIGKGRQVIALHKDGKEVSCWLSVSEQQKYSGRHTFMGTVHEIKSRDLEATKEKFVVLDAIEEAAIVIDTNGIVQFQNEKMERLLGYSAEIVGRNIKEIMPEPYASHHDSYVRNYLKSGKQKVIGLGGRIVVAKDHSGSVIPVQLEVDECILEGHRYFVGVMCRKDTNRKKKATLMEKTRQVVDQLAVAGVVIDKKGIIVAFNRAASVMFGYEQKEVLNENVKVLMNDADAKMHDKYLKNHLQTGEQKVVGKMREVTAKHKNGNLFPVKLSLSKSVDQDDDHNILFTATLMLKDKKEKKEKK